MRAPLVLAGLVLALAQPAMAAAPARRPDLSGFWDLAPNQPADPGLIAKLPPGTVLLKDTGAPELPRGDFGGLKLKPAAVAAAAAWDPKEDLTVAKACSPPSVIYAMQGPFPMEVHQGADMLVFRLEYYDIVRVVFMDGRGHTPAHAPHSKTGHSIGHWEGDTLVVETDHLEPSTLTNNGLNHSEDVRLTERFKLSADGSTLLSTQEFEDPAVLDNRGARFIAWRKKPGEYVFPYDCDPTFGLNYGAKEEGAAK